MVLASTLRLATLAREPYWYDESFTALIARLSPLNALQAIAGDVHPPLWYLIEWLMARVAGAGSLALRLPSAFFGILACYQIYRLVFVMGYKRSASLAALMMAILPAQLYYSQEARAYALLNWLVLFAMTAIYERKWLRSILCLSLLMYVHNEAFLYVIPLGFWMLQRGRSAVIKYLPVSLTYLPWMLTAYHQALAVAGGFWVVRPGAGVLFLDLVYNTFFVRIPSFAQIHVTVLVVVLVLTAIWVLRKQRDLWIVAIMTIVPCLLMYIISIAWKPIQLERALLPSGSLCTVLWSTAAQRLSRKHLAMLAIITAPALALSVVGSYLITKEDFSQNVKIITDNWQQGDVVYHATVPSTIFLADGLAELPQYVLPNVGDLNQSLSDQTKIAMGIKQREVSPADLFDMGYKRLWLLKVTTPGSSQDRLDDVEAILQHYRVIETYHPIDRRFAQLDIVLVDLTMLKLDTLLDFHRLPIGPTNWRNY